MNYYERHLGDYARDTSHLSVLEHGAYTLLLDRYYISEQGIPEDQVHRLARARTREEKQAVDTVLQEFFELQSGTWINRRCEEEIAKARTKIEASRANGRKGGRPKTTNPSPENKTQEKPTGFYPGSENKTQEKAHQTPDTRHQSPDTSLYLHKDTQSSSPTRASAVCVALRAEGIASVNPSHQELLDLLDDGAEIQEFVSAARIAKEKGKGFAYLIGIVKGQRAGAQRVREERPKACAARQPAQQDRLPAWRRDEIRRQFEATPNLVPAELLPQIGIDPETRRPFAKPASGITIIETTAKEIGHEPASDVG